ncbi:MAG: hypothetical protein KAT68_09030 [Bacteroidales bacterium]|nr:hypothetical protein [Bacteroidales bacterium]
MNKTTLYININFKINNIMNTKKIIVFFTFLFLIIFGLQYFGKAQGEPSLTEKISISNTIPASPSAATFERYGEFPISSAYGTTNIDIPLYTIVSGDVSLPVSISYHSGGNKVATPGDWLGLGWNINAGGIISRKLNGHADESGRGYLGAYKSWFLDGDITNDDYYYLDGVAGGGSDTKPDIFSYSLPGYSGIFMFDENGDIKLIPYQPIEVTKIISGYHIISFTIKLTDGTTYIFHDTETTSVINSILYLSSIPEYNSAWHLSRIIAPNGDFINFSYTDYIPEPYPADVLYANTHTMVSGNFNTSPSFIDEKKIYDNRDINGKRLQQITFANGIMVFDGVLKLSKIEIKDNNDVIKKTIRFFINAFANGEGCNAELCPRMKLYKLQIGDKEWKFAYEDILQPPLNSKRRDHWGYYNGANNNTPIPDVKIGPWIYGDGADRNTDPDYVKFGMLKKIEYPTGGYTKFTFGANEISLCDETTGAIHTNVHDIFSKTLYHNSGSTFTTKTYEWPFYVLDKSESGDEGPTWEPTLNFTIEIGTVPKNNSQDPQDYTHDPTFELKRNGTTIFCLTNFTEYYEYYDEYTDMCVYRAIYTHAIGNSDYSDNDIEGKYTVKMLTSTNTANYIKCTIERDGYYMEQPLPNEANMYVGGVRIEKIENHNSDGNFVSKIIYNYNKPDRPNESSAILFHGMLNDLKNNLMYYETFGCGQMNCITIPGCFDHSPVQMIVYDNPVNGYAAGGAVVAYNFVTETKVDKDGNNLGETVYKFSNTKRPSINTYPAIPYPDDKWKSGLLKETKVYNNSNQLVKQIKYKYTPGIYGYINAIAVVKNRGYDWAGHNCCAATLGIDLTRYAYQDYNIWTSWKRKSEEEVVEFFYNDLNLSKEIKTITNYSYTSNDTAWQLLRNKTETTSDKRSIVTEYKYGYELGDFECPGIVREQKISVKNDDETENVINAKAIDYNNNKPEKIFRWFSEVPDTNFIDLHLVDGEEVRDNNYETIPSTILEYNLYGKPIQIAKPDGSITSFIWGYNNTMPIIKAVNETSGNLQTLVDATINNEELAYEDIDEMLTAVGDLTSETQKQIWKTFNTLLRTDLATDVQVITLIYEPLIGIISETDENNVTIFYEYDSFGRLKTVKNDDEKILKDVKYHYAE